MVRGNEKGTVGGRGIEKVLERKEKVSWSGHRREFRYESLKDLGLGLG